MSAETKAKYSPVYLRKRFDRMLERCAWLDNKKEFERAEMRAEEEHGKT